MSNSIKKARWQLKLLGIVLPILALIVTGLSIASMGFEKTFSDERVLTLIFAGVASVVIWRVSMLVFDIFDVKKK